VFAGDLSKVAQLQRYQRLGEALSYKSSCLHKYKCRTNNNKDRITAAPAPGKQHKVQASDNSLVQLFTIHSAKRTSLNLLDLPEVFYGPWDEQLGWDYWKVFADDESLHEGFEDAYSKLGIDRDNGCLVVVRPDQHVSYIGDLEDIDRVKRFFEGCLLQPIE
jgi:phenol 2-monooxygenase